MPRSSRSSGESSVSPLNALREPGAEGDVAGGVLVEERVVEDQARLLDRRGAVDQRDLSEERRLLVDPELMANDLGACGCLASTIFPPSKRTSRSSTRVPAARSGAVERTTPSARRQSGLVKTSSVGMFGMCSMPASVCIRAQVQCALGERGRP